MRKTSIKKKTKKPSKSPYVSHSPIRRGLFAELSVTPKYPTSPKHSYTKEDADLKEASEDDFGIVTFSICLILGGSVLFMVAMGICALIKQCIK